MCSLHPLVISCSELNISIFFFHISPPTVAYFLIRICYCLSRQNVNEPKFKDVMAAENKESFGCNVSSKNVQAGEIVAEGRFAVIRKGFLCQNNQNVPVVMKALRSN